MSLILGSGLSVPYEGLSQLPSRALYVSAENYGQSFEEGERIAQIRFPRSEICVLASRFISKMNKMQGAAQ